ncbi:MAG TPA: hypothetical protein VE621_17155 [Bryobacteraceae bacterium]|jgi:type IV pilus assembly protein PilN|nr:hypothetical protein [Bryobacteraceae bacterium]
MKIGVNLASEPFRRDRPLILGSWIAGALLSILLLMMVVLAVRERHQTAETRELIERSRRQLAAIQAEQAKLDAQIRQPVNAEVLDRSVFVNALLERKGLSWTRIFEDLEKVMPHNVRIISVRPQLNGPNDVLLDMVVGAQQGESVITLLMALESSPVFGTTTIHSTLPPSQTDPLFRYRVSVTYAQKL